jgi:hypothetical protein
MNRPVIGTASVVLRLYAPFGPIITVPDFPAVRPGSTREYKNQRCHHHTDFQKFRFHCLASFVGICLFRRAAVPKGLQKFLSKAFFSPFYLIGFDPH